jgi:hypothetical protein
MIAQMVTMLLKWFRQQGLEFQLSLDPHTFS